MQTSRGTTGGTGDGPNGDLSTRWAYLTIAAAAGAVMLVEVSVTRLLAFRLFYHYVFMVISTALLGLSASGSAVAILSAKGRAFSRKTIVAAAIGFCALAPIVLFVTTRATPAPTLGNGKVEGGVVLYYLPIVYVLLSALFFAAGLIIAILFARFRDHVSRLYFSDLAGAAACSIGAVFLMKYATPIRCFMAAAILLALLAGVLARNHVTRAIVAVVGVGLLYLTVAGPSVFDPGKNMFKRGYQGGRRHHWNHQARVDLRNDIFIIDADASTHRAPSFDGDGGPDLKPINPFYELPYDTLNRSDLRVAVIGAGGGVDLYNALRRGATRIVAIELNQTIYRWMISDPRSVYNKPAVHPVEAEGRHTLRSSDEQFDLIQLSLIDTFTASSQGAYALSENFLYTVEAFDEYLDHLEPNGVLFITRWLFDPPRETLRLFAIADEALRRRGITDPGKHIALVAEHRSQLKKQRGGFILSKSPLDPAALENIRRAVAERGYRSVYLPDEPGDTPFHELMSTGDKDAFYDSYPFRVDPTTDDRPFFFQYFRLSDMRLGKSHLTRYMSQIALFLTLGLAILLATAIVLIPSRRSVLDLSARLRASTSAYFACLGFAFMLVEIPLIQRFTLYLGHPTHALVTILSSLLLFAAIGSLLAGRVPLGKVGRLVVAGVAITVAVLGMVAVPRICAATLGLPLGGRLLVCLLLIAPLGLMLGLPLTLGVRSIASRGEALVAWGWASNGATSVISACLAMIVLIYLGYSYAILFGALFYLGAALLLPLLAPSSAPASREDH